MADLKKNFSPKSISVGAATAALTAIPAIKGSATLTKWPVLFLGGIARNASNSAIVNGAVAVWLNTAAAGSITSADFLTFTDATGRYGVSITGGSKFTVRFYN